MALGLEPTAKATAPVDGGTQVDSLALAALARARDALHSVCVRRVFAIDVVHPACVWAHRDPKPGCWRSARGDQCLGFSGRRCFPSRSWSSKGAAAVVAATANCEHSGRYPLGQLLRQLFTLVRPEDTAVTVARATEDAFWGWIVQPDMHWPGAAPESTELEDHGKCRSPYTPRSRRGR